MNELIAAGIVALVQIWARHNNKPADWKPTPQDIADIINEVDAATPEAEKAAARKRLGLS